MDILVKYIDAKKFLSENKTGDLNRQLAEFNPVFGIFIDAKYLIEARNELRIFYRFYRELRDLYANNLDAAAVLNATVRHRHHNVEVSKKICMLLDCNELNRTFTIDAFIRQCKNNTFHYNFVYYVLEEYVDEIAPLIQNVFYGSLMVNIIFNKEASVEIDLEKQQILSTLNPVFKMKFTKRDIAELAQKYPRRLTSLHTPNRYFHIFVEQNESAVGKVQNLTDAQRQLDHKLHGFKNYRKHHDKKLISADQIPFSELCQFAHCVNVRVAFDLNEFRFDIPYFTQYKDIMFIFN